MSNNKHPIYDYHTQATWKQPHSIYIFDATPTTLFQTWIQSIYISAKKPSHCMYMEKDVWMIIQQVLATSQPISSSSNYIFTKQEDRLQYKRDIFYTWTTQRKKNEKSWKKIHSWFLDEHFETEKDILQYLQWVSDMWNLPILIFSLDTFLLKPPESYTSWKDCPIYFSSNTSSWPIQTSHLPILFCFVSNGSFFYLKENPFLPSFLPLDYLSFIHT
jgi:hypothetical protein